jgi:hypothetical protein
MKYIKRMFGIDLTTLVKAQNTLIPAVVELCIKEIENRGSMICFSFFHCALPQRSELIAFEQYIC